MNRYTGTTPWRFHAARPAWLLDAGTFTELGIHAGIHYSVRGLEDTERRPTA